MRRTYSISEVGTILERSIYWLRWKEKKLIAAGQFVRQDGSPLHIARSLSSSGTVEQYSRRRYTIGDIEDMAELFISLGLYLPHVAFRVQTVIKLYKSREEGS